MWHLIIIKEVRLLLADIVRHGVSDCGTSKSSAQHLPTSIQHLLFTTCVHGLSELSDPVIKHGEFQHPKPFSLGSSHIPPGTSRCGRRGWRHGPSGSSTGPSVLLWMLKIYVERCWKYIRDHFYCPSSKEMNCYLVLIWFKFKSFSLEPIFRKKMSDGQTPISETPNASSFRLLIAPDCPIAPLPQPGSGAAVTESSEARPGSIQISGSSKI